MAKDNVKKQPGDIILDHYMPSADDAARERARENLRRLAALVARILQRQAETRFAEFGHPR